MAANLSPEYRAAEEEYRSAATAADRIAALEKMLSTLPKHKGTEKMQADLKRRLSEARKDAQKKGAAHATPFYQVTREGAGQVALLGPPNSGKSSLLRALTHARPEVADFPFTTRVPMPGMMKFENVPIQLLDLPPIAPDFMEFWLAQVVRNANASVLVVDVSDPGNLENIEFIETTLREWHCPPPGLLAGNKLDQPGGQANFDVLRDLYADRYRILPISLVTGEGLAGFPQAVFDLLHLVRVYTKAPGKEADFGTPYVLKQGATVLDAARHVHRDFAEHLKFARLFRGQHGVMVDRHHLVQDQDILEFHI